MGGQGLTLADLLPPGRRAYFRQVGAKEDCSERLCRTMPEPFAIGRGGEHLAASCSIVEHMMTPSA